MTTKLCPRCGSRVSRVDTEHEVYYQCASWDCKDGTDRSCFHFKQLVDPSDLPFIVYIYPFKFKKGKTKYYVGYTGNLERRRMEHANGKRPYEGHRICGDLVVYRRLKTRADAMRVERKTKKRNDKKDLYVQYSRRI